MSLRSLRACCAFSLLLCLPTISLANDPLRPGNGRILRGKELFEKPFAPSDPTQKVNGKASDGLGPAFNAKSCHECHNVGGVGGAGLNKSNVQLLTFRHTGVRPNATKQSEIKRQLKEIHPGFGNGSSIILHRFGWNADYSRWREQVLGLVASDDVPISRRRRVRNRLLSKRKKQGPVVQVKYQGLSFLVSERNTPSLFGLSQIDEIDSDVIREEARRQQRSGSPVSGRVAFMDGESVGRFGWRGQMASLRDFVITACAVELGLQVKDRKQEVNRFVPAYELEGEDLSLTQLEEMLAFVESLPKPVRRTPRSDVERNTIRRGEVLFNNLKCSACHLERLGDVKGLYTDLLLHDMGSRLADPVPARPAQKFVGMRVFGGYIGGVEEVFTAIPSKTTQEWRTPPLWGIASSAPYIHDGRAANLHQAILWHGGEAFASAQGYSTLPGSEQAAVIAFLRSLVVPIQ